MNDNAKVRFYIDKTGFFAESAMILFLLSAIFRFIGCWGLWNDRVNFIMVFLLPLCCCVLMTLAILLFGKKGFFLSFIPVLLGVVFFVYQALSYDSWVHTVLCILLYLVIALVYTATVFGWIRTKWLLPPLFGLPFLYHIIMEDIPALSNTAEPVTFAAGMQEMSVLCIMAAMFCVSMGLIKKYKTPAASAASAVSAAEPAPVQPASAKPAAPVQPAPAAAPAQTAQPAETPAPEDDSILTAPYTPMLTLDPDFTGPEDRAEENADESKHE